MNINARHRESHELTVTFLKDEDSMRERLKKSLHMQERAKARIPGMTQLLSKRPDRFSLGVWPGYYSRAKGAEVWDLDGNRYLDMSISGIGANVLGYGDPDVDGAVVDAISKGSSSSLNCPEEIELAELLCELHPWADMARFTRAGGEAMAVAVRIARAFRQRDKVAFCGYHGWHDWYLAANLGTENALGEHLIAGLDPRGVPRGLTGTAFPFRYNDIQSLKTIVAGHGKDLAAVVMEPVRSTEPEKGFLESVQELARDCGAVLVIDEISAGFRINTGGAHLVYGLTPDIAVFSKALGNGYPISAVIGKSKVMEAAQNTFISSTNWTERIGPVAAIATIRKHRDKRVPEHLINLGTTVQQGWLRIAGKHRIPIHISGLKPMGHFVFDSNLNQMMKAYLIQLMMERGILASNLLYLMYAHTEEHVERYLEALDYAFGELREAVAAGSIESKLIGEPSASGFQRLA